MKFFRKGTRFFAIIPIAEMDKLSDEEKMAIEKDYVDSGVLRKHNQYANHVFIPLSVMVGLAGIFYGATHNWETWMGALFPVLVIFSVIFLKSYFLVFLYRYYVWKKIAELNEDLP